MLNISRQRLGPFMCVAGASGYRRRKVDHWGQAAE